MVSSVVIFFFFLMLRRPPRSTLFPYTTALPIFELGPRLPEPCLHIHLAEELARRGKMPSRCARVSALSQGAAEHEVAVGHQRAHPEPCGYRQSLATVFHRPG